MRKFIKLYYLQLLVSVVFIEACSQIRKAEFKQLKAQSEYYAVDDFRSVDKIDAHTHLRTKDTTYIKEAEAFNFRLLNVNVYTFSGTPIEEQQKQAIIWVKAFPGRSSYATTFSLKNYNEDGWQQEAIDYLKNSFQQGAIAVKIWKNVGMELKDKNGKLVMIDNPRFDPVLNYLAKNKIPVIGHIGEPRNCWLPVEQMTVTGDKKYFTENPKYHMYLHPELPSYEQQIAARDHMLERHPDLKFVGAHLGSLEWSVDELAKRLDKFPNMAVDMAARIPHFRYQAINNWQKVHDFFIKYQDRLLYGTDIVADERKTSAQIKTLSNDLWLSDWKFFVTDEEMRAPQVEGEFKGLKLPRQVIDKIYRKNAEKWFPGIVKS
jgi:predicted TIM-barrel fold metal-dependent hydrolase